MIADQIKYRKGSMGKSVFEMSESEFHIWQENNKKNARKYLFSIGQPLVYFKNNKPVAEFEDGRIDIIK